MGSARVSLLEASVELSALVMPPEMATEIRLGQDLDLSAQVVEVVVEVIFLKNGSIYQVKHNASQMIGCNSISTCMTFVDIALYIITQMIVCIGMDM